MFAWIHQCLSRGRPSTPQVPPGVEWENTQPLLRDDDESGRPVPRGFIPVLNAAVAGGDAGRNAQASSPE